MASAREELEELKRLEEEMAMLRQVNARELDRMNQSISAQVEGSRRILDQEEQLGRARANNERLAERIRRIRDEERRGLVQLSAEERRRLKSQEDLVAETRTELALREKQLGFMRSQLDVSKAIAGSVHEWYNVGKMALLGVFAAMPAFLFEADQLLRSAAKETGLGATHMGRMRDTLMDASMRAARLGATTKEIVESQEKYLAVTGKLQLLSVQQTVSLMALAEGTALGTKGAAEMAGKMELIGYNASDTAGFLGEAVNRTEAMGLNAGKVLKTMSETLDRSRQFTFRDGVAGLERMAQNAQRLKVSVEGTFAAADKARTLEGSLNMAANLAVLGGNFAKADPFQLSFLSRNDPAKFQEALAGMTKGMATFNRQSGQMEVSAYNMDRLRAAAEATGQPFDDLIKSATEAGKLDIMKGQLFVGSKEQREMIMSMAQMGKNGRATIMLQGKDIDISKLSNEHLRMLTAEKTTLEERAKQAQGFDKTWSVFVQELKATAMPLLETTNSLLKGVHTVMDKVHNVLGDSGMRWVLGLTAGAFALSKAFTVGRGLMGLGGASAGGGGLFSGIMGKFFGKGGGAPTPPVVPPGGGTGGRIGSLLGGGGLGGAATMLAAGGAAVGLGYGFKLAAEGAATFATALEKLKPEQLATLEHVMTGLGIGMGVMVAGLVALGTVAGNPVTALGIGVIAAGVMGIGFGVKMATEGIGTMATGLTGLASVDLSRLGNFFGQLSDFMSGDTANLDKLLSTVEALNQKSQDNFIDRLEALWNTPLKLEAKEVSFQANIEVVNILDGEKMVSKYAKRFQAAIVQGAKGSRSFG